MYTLYAPSPDLGAQPCWLREARDAMRLTSVEAAATATQTPTGEAKMVAELAGNTTLR